MLSYRNSDILKRLKKKPISGTLVIESNDGMRWTMEQHPEIDALMRKSMLGVGFAVDAYGNYWMHRSAMDDIVDTLSTKLYFAGFVINRTDYRDNTYTIEYTINI